MPEFLSPIQLANLTSPATPASGVSSLYVDSQKLVPCWNDSAGTKHSMTPALGGIPCVADQAINSATAVLVTGCTAVIPPNSIPAGGGVIVRTTILWLGGTSVGAVTLKGLIGTNNSASLDTPYASPAAFTPTASALTRWFVEFTFRSPSNAYWSEYIMGSSAVSGVNGGAVTPSLSTSATNYWNISASIVVGTSNSVTIHQAYTEILSI